MRNTLTLDNGKEFAAHKSLSQALGLDIYFAHPYHFMGAGAERTRQWADTAVPAQKNTI
jgi:IS30 family transposase